MNIKDLLKSFPRTGRVVWIGLRPERRGPVAEVEQVLASVEEGLLGDHYAGRRDSPASGKRHVTLIQAEHLPAIGSYLGRDTVNPAELRRNLVVSGLNLLTLKDTRFRIGKAVLEYTGECHPCTKMEATLGPGGYNAVRGHGGITARVVEGGEIRLGDTVEVLVDGVY
ncbi:MOSC domain-containing protein [Rudanella paleaurantiibacter]|uniref:MOSC domain-containing protein n=1 Tax=Rudanella paleaurantiibacter TaxID=2614655 RepID=A0A7J5U5L1_9BACT|nr:MOSC domain-containing protein [Rudanella paleaurantiibacter]KAB7733128.1 MOSC domain-containing protein [Rudanella paleaurantiibacter]